jgi:prophage antirepressor-like protein
MNGEPWFVGKDVAVALGYNNTRDALLKHVNAEDKAILQKSQNATFNLPARGLSIINESGLYCLVMSSKLPQAKAFKRWVTSIVLPSIRKFGAYATDDTIENMLRSPEFTEALIKSLAEERKKILALEELTDELAPKARYYDFILQSKNTVPVSLISKDYGLSAMSFNRLLHEIGIQYRIAGTWLLYQDFAGRGYTQTHTYPVNETTSAVHTCWTQKGRLFLYETLKSWGILPLIEKPAIKE